MPVARSAERPLKWLKTDHAYPIARLCWPTSGRLGEILVGSGALTRAALEAALETQAAGVVWASIW